MQKVDLIKLRKCSFHWSFSMDLWLEFWFKFMLYSPFFGVYISRKRIFFFGFKLFSFFYIFFGSKGLGIWIDLFKIHIRKSNFKNTNWHLHYLFFEKYMAEAFEYFPYFWAIKIIQWAKKKTTENPSYPKSLISFLLA